MRGQGRAGGVTLGGGTLVLALTRMVDSALPHRGGSFFDQHFLNAEREDERLLRRSASAVGL